MAGVVNEDEYVGAGGCELFPGDGGPVVINIARCVGGAGCRDDGLGTAEATGGKHTVTALVENEGDGLGLRLRRSLQPIKSRVLIFNDFLGGFFVTEGGAEVVKVFAHGLPRFDGAAFCAVGLAAGFGEYVGANAMAGEGFGVHSVGIIHTVVPASDINIGGFGDNLFESGGLVA